MPTAGCRAITILREDAPGDHRSARAINVLLVAAGMRCQADSYRKRSGRLAHFARLAKFRVKSTPKLVGVSIDVDAHGFSRYERIAIKDEGLVGGRENTATEVVMATS